MGNLSRQQGAAALAPKAQSMSATNTVVGCDSESNFLCMAGQSRAVSATLKSDTISNHVGKGFIAED